MVNPPCINATVWQTPDSLRFTAASIASDVSEALLVLIDLVVFKWVYATVATVLTVWAENRLGTTLFFPNLRKHYFGLSMHYLVTISIWAAFKLS